MSKMENSLPEKERDPGPQPGTRSSFLSAAGSPYVGGINRWNVILRCHNCRRPFTVNGMPIKRVALLPQVTPCPHCAAGSVAAQRRGAAHKLHQIIDLRHEAG